MSHAKNSYDNALMKSSRGFIRQEIAIAGI